MRGRVAIDEVGNRYGKLTVINRAGICRGRATWLCHCDCGSDKIIPGVLLRNGYTKSCGCLYRLKKGEAAFNILFGDLKRSAERRKHTWALSEEDVRQLTSQPCYYCGREPQQSRIVRRRGVNGDYLCNGIDRVDNSKGYSKDNVVPCCSKCNVAKHTMTREEFLSWISSVYEYSNLQHGSDTNYI